MSASKKFASSTKSYEEERAIEKKKKLIVRGCTLLFPSYYIFTRRNVIYRATSEVRGYYVKEILMRIPLGYVVGLGISIGLYGLTTLSPR